MDAATLAAYRQAEEADRSELDMLRDVACTRSAFVHQTGSDAFRVESQTGKRLLLGTAAEVTRFLRARPASSLRNSIGGRT
jgi:hypothetical protein